MSPREAPSDRPEKHLPPARIFSKAKRRTGQFRPRPTLVNAHESPSQKRALLPAQDPCRGRRDRPPRPASLRRLHPHHRPKEEGASAGDGRPGPGIRKCSEAGWCPLSSPRAPAPPQPDSRRPLSAARGAPYLCVELGRGHGGPAAPTPPACAEAAPRLGGRPRRLGSAQAAAGGKQGRAGGAAQARAARGGLAIAPGLAASSYERSACPGSSESPRSPLAEGDAAAAAAAALCIVGAGGGCSGAVPAAAPGSLELTLPPIGCGLRASAAGQPALP